MCEGPSLYAFATASLEDAPDFEARDDGATYADEAHLAPLWRAQTRGQSLLDGHMRERIKVMDGLQDETVSFLRASLPSQSAAIVSPKEKAALEDATTLCSVLLPSAWPALSIYRPPLADAGKGAVLRAYAVCLHAKSSTAQSAAAPISPTAVEHAYQRATAATPKAWGLEQMWWWYTRATARCALDHPEVYERATEGFDEAVATTADCSLWLEELRIRARGGRPPRRMIALEGGLAAHYALLLETGRSAESYACIAHALSSVFGDDEANRCMRHPHTHAAGMKHACNRHETCMQQACNRHAAYVQTCSRHAAGAAGMQQACSRHAAGMLQACCICATGTQHACLRHATCVQHACCNIHATYLQIDGHHACSAHATCVQHACNIQMTCT